MSKRRPRKEDGLDLLIRAFGTGSSGEAVRSQEADGQRSFVGSDTLPTDMRGDARAVLEAAGVEFLGTVEDDPMFQYVELPEGWEKVGTDHSMWSELVDEKGRKRASIFYKAAFYDRSAHIGVNRRYGFRLDYDRLENDGVAVVNITDCGEVIHTTEPIQFDEDTRYEAQDEAREKAKSWLDEHYPLWEEASMYWD